MQHTPPAVTFSLTIAEARALFEDLEDVHEATSGPGISIPTLRLMAELGATLEDGGYLDDDPEPDPEDPEPEGNVIAIDFRKGHSDPAVVDWQKIIQEQAEKCRQRYPYIWNDSEFRVTC